MRKRFDSKNILTGSLVLLLCAALAAPALAQRPSLGGLQTQIDENRADIDLLLDELPIVTVHRGLRLEAIDNGILPSRTFSFTKFFDSTTLRITYFDHFAVQTSGPTQAPFWTVHIDGVPTDIIQFHVETGGSRHNSSNTIMGYVDNVAAGPHVVTVVVVNTLGTGVRTGQRDIEFIIEVEERLPPNAPIP